MQFLRKQLLRCCRCSLSLDVSAVLGVWQRTPVLAALFIEFPFRQHLNLVFVPSLVEECSISALAPGLRLVRETRRRATASRSRAFLITTTGRFLRTSFAAGAM